MDKLPCQTAKTSRLSNRPFYQSHQLEDEESNAPDSSLVLYRPRVSSSVTDLFLHHLETPSGQGFKWLLKMRWYVPELMEFGCLLCRCGPKIHRCCTVPCCCCKSAVLQHYLWFSMDVVICLTAIVTLVNWQHCSIIFLCWLDLVGTVSCVFYRGAFEWYSV